MRKHCLEVQESAGILELVKYNHFGEAYVLDIEEYDTSDIYDWRLQPMLAAEAPMDAKSWMEARPPWRIQTMTYAGIYGPQE